MTKWEVWFILAKVKVENLLFFLFVYLSVFDLLLYDIVRYMFMWEGVHSGENSHNLTLTQTGDYAHHIPFKKRLNTIECASNSIQLVISILMQLIS